MPEVEYNGFFAEGYVLEERMESEMVSAMTWVPNICTWEDSGPNHWGNVLMQNLGTQRCRLGVEKAVLPSLVRIWLDDSTDSLELIDWCSQLQLDIELIDRGEGGRISA